MANLHNNWRELSARLIAEFAIVVLGVTIALWADSWGTARGDHAEETARLYALRDNVTQTLAIVRDERDRSTGAVDALRKLVNQNEFPLDELRDLLRYGLLYGPTFSPELNVYDDLKNSGELGQKVMKAIAKSGN